MSYLRVMRVGLGSAILRTGGKYAKAAETMSAIVEVDGLRKEYGSAGNQVLAVNGLDLTIGAPGTVHGFLGPNGSGTVSYTHLTLPTTPYV